MVGFILTIVRSMLIMLPELTATDLIFHDGNAKFRQGMSRRTQDMNDFGPAAANSATIINIDLTIVSMKPTIRERVVGRED
jgi:hypothetical protein